LFATPLTIVFLFNVFLDHINDLTWIVTWWWTSVCIRFILYRMVLWSHINFIIFFFNHLHIASKFPADVGLFPFNSVWTLSRDRWLWSLSHSDIRSFLDVWGYTFHLTEIGIWPFFNIFNVNVVYHYLLSQHINFFEQIPIQNLHMIKLIIKLHNRGF